MKENIKQIEIQDLKTFSKPRLKWIRRLSQISMLFVIGEFSFYGIFRCPFAVPYVSCAGCPVIQCPGRWMVFPFWIVLGVSAVFFGRAFCGWACPGGLVSELVSKLLNIGKKIKGRIDVKLQWLKYLVLAATLILWLYLLNPRWAIPIRTGDFFNSVRLTFQHANNLWLIKAFFIIGIIVMGGVIGSLWCRFLCPLGGALELFRRFSLFQFKKTSACNNCGLCSNVCPMNTEPENYNCANCGDCKNSCPSDAIYFGSRFGSSQINSGERKK